MEYKSIKISSDLLFKVLFHVLFWFFWLVLPSLSAFLDEDTKRYEFLMKILPLNFMCVPFFYFNSDFLIPRLIPKEKITTYILSLLVLLIIFWGSYYLFKDYLVDNVPIRVYDSRNMFPVLLIISTSTLYGILIVLGKQAKTSQEVQAEQLKSELSFLRSQISPHFIFNVLNSIVYLIRSKSKNAEKVTLELAELIRYMLYESEIKQVSLEKELDYLNNYVALQKTRFGEDVEINIKIEGNLKNKWVEPMLLIPFVENAFKHGVGFVKNPKIEIDINSQSEKFLFKVKNTVGPESLEQKDPNSGIGLKNVKRRIELLYENRHELEIKQNAGFFEIELMLKLKTD
jgi:two-component system, LytTR family, sensor kinase